MNVTALCARFGLGEFISSSAVAGGRSNELYRVTTDRGVFAAKRMLVNADSPEFSDNIAGAFAIEERAFIHGVPMPEPVADPQSGRALARIDDSWWRVHRWVEGSMLESVSVGDAADAGALLAAIHRAGEVTADGKVGTHADLDPKNTLRTPGGELLAVDWDAAVFMHPAEELIQLALDWSLEEDRVNEELFAVVLSSYRRAEGPARPYADKSLFDGWMRAYRGWLEYNLSQRMDTELGRREAATTQARMIVVTRQMDELLLLLGDS